MARAATLFRQIACESPDYHLGNTSTVFASKSLGHDWLAEHGWAACSAIDRPSRQSVKVRGWRWSGKRDRQRHVGIGESYDVVLTPDSRHLNDQR